MPILNLLLCLSVCEKILDAAALVMHVIDVPLELLLQFVSTLPQESTNYGGICDILIAILIGSKLLLYRMAKWLDLTLMGLVLGWARLGFA